MKRMTQSGILSSALLLGIAGIPIPAVAVSEQSKNLMIAEVSPEADTASKEHVVIYNPNPLDVDVSGWMLQYRSASHRPDDSKGWSVKGIIGCRFVKASDCQALDTVLIRAGETLRLSSDQTDQDAQLLTSGMATAGGQVRLVQPDKEGGSGIAHDLVGYGTAAAFEGVKAAVAPKPSRSIVRLQDAAGTYIDTDHNDADFMLSPDESAPADPSSVTPGGSDNSGSDQGGLSYRDVEITELLPDPVSPALDSADEFIEFYNPHSDELDLTGYTLKTGTGWTHKYTLKDVVLQPQEYVALMASQTHLPLSNSGTSVRLYDPAGRLVVEVSSYGKAQPGNSWIRDGQGVWRWTAKPTPGEQNVMELPPAPPAKLATSSAKKPSAKAAAKKSSTPKTSSSAVKGAIATAGQPARASTGNQLGMWVLGVAAALGLGYALFEYRQDIGRFVRQKWRALARFGSRR